VSEIRFRSDIGVALSQQVGTDRDILFAARAIPPVKSYGPQADGDTPEACRRTLGACMRLAHNSPFEHGLLSVYAEAPGVVWWQLTRQRFMSLDSEDFSFNLESGRYRVLEPEFYLPPSDRPMIEPDNFKPMRPALDAVEGADRLDAIHGQFQDGFAESWNRYERLIDLGVAREVARLALPNWALYCDGYVTAKPLTWLQFFSKRRKTDATAVATFPMFEIEKFAEACEALFAAHWPITHEAFVGNGRVAP
jgi:thymidylate synthase (FAD)